MRSPSQYPRVADISKISSGLWRALTAILFDWGVDADIGRIALADFCTVPNAPSTEPNTELMRRRWQIPKENMYSSEIYQAKLAAAGFSKVKLQSIWHEVVPPYWDFVRTRLDDAEVVRRFNPVLLRRLKLGLRAPQPASPQIIDYVLVYAEKPF